MGVRLILSGFLMTVLLWASPSAFSSTFANAGPGTKYSEQEASELTDQELFVIRKRILKRCGISQKLSKNKLPWYFYYEFGVELINMGAADRAVESLQMTANLKAEPMRGARMYGMWFINYLPYYQMSLAWSELREWDRAWDAIRMSEELVEFSPGDFEYEKFASLRDLIEKNRRSAG